MKKIITLLLIAALSAGTAVMAEEVAEHDVLLISETEEAMPMFVESTVGAAKLYEEDGVKYVSAVDAYDQEVRFVLTEHTVIINEQGEKAELEDGAQFTAYTAWNSPAPLVLPPIYYPDAIVIDTDVDLITNADTYRKDGEVYTNSANTLSIVLGEVNVVDADGNAYEGDIDGKNLVVVYGVTTRSLPPIANPAHVVVLGDAQEELAEEAMEIAVGDKKFEIVEKNGTKMAAVRAVSEELGLEVKWDNDLQAVTVGTVPMGVNFLIGVNSYNKARMTPFTLEGAPYLEMTEAGGVTYVPVSFFTEVLGCAAETADGVMTLTF